MSTPPTFSLTRDEEWETPQSLFDQACLDYDIKPVLDVCATKKNKKCKQYFDKAMDSLNRPWDRPFFLNPPYWNVKLWIAKAYLEHRLRNTSGMALIFAKTDTQMWHNFVEGKAEVHFVKSRIKFEKKGVIPKYCRVCKKIRIQEDPICPDCLRMMNKNSAPYPSCWVIWRKK